MWPVIAHSERGRVVATDAVAIAFFIDAVHAEAAARVLVAIDEFVQHVGFAALPWYLDEDGEEQPLDRGSYAELRARLVRTARAGGEGGMRLIGDPRDVAGTRVYYYGEALPSAELPEWRNVLVFHLSRAAYLELGPARLRLWVRRLAQPIPYSFAYASPAILYDDAIGVAAKLARRYPGLDILNQGAAATSIGDKAAGVYWLSYLGPALAAALGGAVELRARLAGAAEIVELADGRVEMALGPEPALGDRNRREALPSYRRAAALLEPRLHIPDIVYFVEEDEVTPDRDAMIGWHRRFLD
jgi:Protein of unknown function (DUF3396)